MSVTFGAPYIVTVALKQIAAEFGGQRSVPAAAMSLTWLGTGTGGVLMGWVAERVGVRWTVVGGASMVLLGLIRVRRRFTVGALRRPRASDRPCRQCRAQCTDIRLRLPMVPAPPGNGAVSHFQRPVHCRCTVAAGLRTHDRAVRMAIDNGGLRDCCRGDHHSPGSRLSQSRATEPPTRFPPRTQR